MLIFHNLRSLAFPRNFRICLREPSGGAEAWIPKLPKPTIDCENEKSVPRVGVSTLLMQ